MPSKSNKFKATKKAAMSSSSSESESEGRGPSAKSRDVKVTPEKMRPDSVPASQARDLSADLFDSQLSPVNPVVGEAIDGRSKVTAEDPLDLLQRWFKDNNISTEWGYNAHNTESKVQDSKTISARRSLLSEQLHLGDSGDYSVQILCGFDAISSKISVRLMIGNNWTCTKQRKNELGEPCTTFWFSKVKINEMDKDALRKAIKGDEDDEVFYDTNSSDQWPTTGQFLPMDVLMDFLRRRDEIFSLIQSTSLRMTKVLDSNPSLVKMLVKEAKSRNDSYYNRRSKTSYVRVP